MPASTENILLVNYDFPPNQGIGGRRWAKLAKQLAKKGYGVKVIKADPVSGNSISPWTNDVHDPRIEVFSLPRNYPSAFSHPGNGFLDKVKYRLAKSKLERSEKGTIYDLSIGWETSFAKQAEKWIHEFNIKNVIVTGAPWNLLLYSARLKQKFPALHLVMDFRDPWLNAVNYGMADLNPERKAAEREKFDYAMSKADVVTVPNNAMIEELKEMIKGHPFPRLEVLEHFFDPDDIPTPLPGTEKKTIDIIYGGDLYIGLEPQLEQLKDQLLHLKSKRPDLYSRVKVKIYTNAKTHSALQGVEAIEIIPSVGKALFNEINKSDFCLILLSEKKKNEPTTKFVEYLPFRKPLIVFSPAGALSDFVRKNDLGFVPAEQEGGLEKILDDFISGRLKVNKAFDITPWQLDAATNKLITFLK